MIGIKYPDKNTDFSKVKCSKVNWDLEVDNISYDIYSIDDYYHCIGGKYGLNNWWCCPYGEEPSYKNLMAFNGYAPIWGIEYKSTNRIKTKWGDSSVECYGRCVITRNGKPFYSFGARDMVYGLAKAQTVLTEIQEHLLNFHFRDWKKEVLNRKIYYGNQPAIVTDILDFDGTLDVLISPDKDYIKEFERPAFVKESDNDDYYQESYKDVIKDDILTPNIYWFRGD